MSSVEEKTVIRQGEQGTLLVEGELSFATVKALLEQSRPLLGAAKGTLVMELAKVGRVDSAGLALLIQWMRMARGQGVDISFRHLPGQLLAIARASELDEILPVEEG